jgi:hypothetical protein
MKEEIFWIYMESEHTLRRGGRAQLVRRIWQDCRGETRGGDPRRLWRKDTAGSACTRNRNRSNLRIGLRAGHGRAPSRPPRK